MFTNDKTKMNKTWSLHSWDLESIEYLQSCKHTDHFLVMKGIANALKTYTNIHLCWEDFSQITFEQILKVSMYLPVTDLKIILFFLGGEGRECVVKG